MPETQTFRRLATRIELEHSPFPIDPGYQQVLRADNSPEAWSGGMGVVFHARDVQLGRDVAIKRMGADIPGDAAFQERFLLEARAQALLKHQNIVTVYAAKQDAHGPWLVLEWVDGQSLKELYADDFGLRPSPEDAVDWVLQIAEALIYVHDHQLIHRDVKPANILLRTSDRRPLLTDFGLVADRRLSRMMSGVSVSGMSMGTVDFMAPEQDRDASKVTPLADQWSLGATLAWLITGNTMRTLRERDLPVTLREAVFKATEKHPQDRFRDLKEFRDMLKGAVSGPAVPATPASPGRAAPPQATGDTAATADPITASGIDGQCWKCGCVNSDSRKFCKACGEATREACLNVKCQLPIGVWERFCPECGEDQPRQREVRLRRVQESGDLIRRHLQQQRYDLALAELQQLDSQCTTPRLRLLLAPVEGLETDAQQLQQAVQQILQRAIEQATACDYAEALQTLQEVPDVFWPEDAVTWQQSVTELQTLQDALQPLVGRGRLDGLKQALQRLQQLQPGHWSAAEHIARCVEVLVERARQLHASEQLDAALEQLESIPVTDRTDSCRQYSAALQEELDALERRGTELAAVGNYDEALDLFRNLSEQRRPRSWSAWRAAAEKVDQLREQLNAELPKARLENCLRILEELRTLQPGRWEHEPRLASVVSQLVTQAEKSLEQGQTDKAEALLAKIPASLQTDAVRKTVARLQQRQAEDATLLRLEGPFSAETARKAQAALARSLQMPEEWTNSVGMKFRPIPVGTYKRITITKPFWLGIHQVTQGQWQQVMGTTPWKGNRTIYGKDVAASSVSWSNAVAFCEKLSRKEGKRYRLPTEAEWEWACRAGTMTAYSFGNDERQLGEYAWFNGNAGPCPYRVGQKKANPFGLYDVHGNVFEWCSDWYVAGDPTNAVAIDPQGPPSGAERVIRGSSWLEGPNAAKSSFRAKRPPHYDGGIGCRVVLECG